MTVLVVVGVVADAFDDYVVGVDFAAAAAAFATVDAPASSAALLVAPVVVAPPIVDDGPPLPPRIVDRSSLAKLEFRVEKFPPSKPVAPADRAGSWACCRIFALVQCP